MGMEATSAQEKYHPDNSLVCATISVASANLGFTTTSKGNGRLQYTMKIAARKIWETISYDFTPSTTVAVKSGMIGFPVWSSTTGEIVAVQRRRAIMMNSVSLAK